MMQVVKVEPQVGQALLVCLQAQALEVVVFLEILGHQVLGHQVLDRNLPLHLVELVVQC